MIRYLIASLLLIVFGCAKNEVDLEGIVIPETIDTTTTKQRFK